MKETSELCEMIFSSYNNGKVIIMKPHDYFAQITSCKKIGQML